MAAKYFQETVRTCDPILLSKYNQYTISLTRSLFEIFDSSSRPNIGHGKLKQVLVQNLCHLSLHLSLT
jgi:hypothetical protein